MSTPAAQDNRQGSVHPPEPAGQEFDMLRLPNSRSPNHLVPDLRGRSQEFSRCLGQLFTCAADYARKSASCPCGAIIQADSRNAALKELARHKSAEHSSKAHKQRSKT
jgi:hypothetical protein